MATPILEKKIWHYAEKLHRKKEGCSFVSGAEYSHCKQVAKSGDHLNGIVDSLRIELEKFGEIGEKKYGSSIGHCAEAVAVNRVLEIHPNQLAKVDVGRAIRPKTLQFRKKCRICRNMF